MAQAKKGGNDPENQSKGRVDLSSKDEMSQLIQNKKRELAQSEQIKEENDRKRKIFVKRQWARLQPLKKPD